MITANSFRPAIAVFLKAGFALLGGGMAYVVWLGYLLTITNTSLTPNPTILWLLAPVLTASGFAGASVGYDRVLHKPGRDPGHVYLWSLTASASGALLVYWFGPMLIVFGMLVSGTLAIALLEWAHIRGGE